MLDQLRLSLAGRVRWGHKIAADRPGIYFVSLSSDPGLNAGVLQEAPISREAVEAWLERVPSFTLGSVMRPRAGDVVAFLRRFWFPDENIVYIGRAKRLGPRIWQLFRHRLGDRRPHAGGQWLKTLPCLEALHVYFSECGSLVDAKAKEPAALDVFVRQVSEDTKAQLLNPDLPIPFANREHPQGNRKQNCISHSVLR